MASSAAVAVVEVVGSNVFVVAAWAVVAASPVALVVATVDMRRVVVAVVAVLSCCD